MKNTMMMMVGAAAGIGIYMGVEKMTKNKKVIDNSPFGWYNNMRRQE